MKILCPYSARKLWYARKIYRILLLSRAIRLEIMYRARPYRFLFQASSIGLLSRWQQATAGGLVNHYYTKRWATTRMIEIIPDTPMDTPPYRS
jgi:hypothetical protein